MFSVKTEVEKPGRAAEVSGVSHYIQTTPLYGRVDTDAVVFLKIDDIQALIHFSTNKVTVAVNEHQTAQIINMESLRVKIVREEWAS